MEIKKSKKQALEDATEILKHIERTQGRINELEDVIRICEENRCEHDYDTEINTMLNAIRDDFEAEIVSAQIAYAIKGLIITEYKLNIKKAVKDFNRFKIK